MLKIFRQYYPVRNLIFITGEFLLIFLSVLIAAIIFLGKGCFYPQHHVLLKGFIIAVTCQLCIYYNDLYDFQVVDSFSELSIRLCQALGASSIIFAGVYFLFPQMIIGVGIHAVSVGFIMLLIALWRFGYAFMLTRGVLNEKIILMGSGKLAQNIITEISEKRDSGYTISAGIAEPGVNYDCGIPENMAIVCKSTYDGLCDMTKEMKIKKIIVALQQRRGNFPAKELLRCRVDGIEIIEGTTFYEMLTGKLIVDEINPAWLIFSSGFKKTRKKRFMKRLGDILLSSILLVFLAPFIALIAILIKIDSPGPVIFSQDRVGAKKRPYRMLKFRSMIKDAEKMSGPIWASDNDDRITRIGAIMRKLRIDEIPQLWNVLKGEMSFVGPRPEREFFVNQLEETIPYYGQRFTVKPGITGWAQISYGYGASVEEANEKLKYDLFYTKNFSILMDLMIIIRTVKTVFFGKGAR